MIMISTTDCDHLRLEAFQLIKN